MEALPKDQRPGPVNSDRFSFPIGMDESGRFFTLPGDPHDTGSTSSSDSNSEQRKP